MKCNRQAIVADVPALCYTGLRFQGVRIFDRKSFEERINNQTFWNSGHNMRIQALWFCAISEVQYAIAIALNDIGFTAAAGQQGKAGENKA